MMHKRGNLRWWLATVLGALMVCLGIALGFWQLDRAAQKKTRQAALEAQASAPMLDAAAVGASLMEPNVAIPSLMHRSIRLQGHWLAEQTVYLDNRQMHGRPGFFVLTPLQLSAGDVVMVQRGWIARNFQDRLALQQVDTPEGAVQVDGVVAGPPARLYALGDGDVPDVAHPHIRQNLDLSDFAHRAGLVLWPVTVIQTGAASEGLLRDWLPVGSGIATHYGYAFQWFAIAAVLASMLLWFQFFRPARAGHSHDVSTEF